MKMMTFIVILLIFIMIILMLIEKHLYRILKVHEFNSGLVYHKSIQDYREKKPEEDQKPVEDKKNSVSNNWIDHLIDN